MKPVIPRVAAERDVDGIADRCTDEAGEDVAAAFVGALNSAYRAIAEHPGAGSPRFSYAIDVKSLRSWRLIRFPYLVFYVEEADRVEIWRVLHERRDIFAILAGDPE